jgi:hypothetical protein
MRIFLLMNAFATILAWKHATYQFQANEFLFFKQPRQMNLRGGSAFAIQVIPNFYGL